MQRLARNIGGYKGETIDIHRVLADIDKLARQTHWEAERLIVSDTTSIPAYRKTSSTAEKHIYISAGIHGDEPASPLSVLKLFQDNQWPEHLNVWLLPCLNPLGFVNNRRVNEDGIDLNRDYRSLSTDIVRTHTGWLNALPRFTISISLHEDWESNGFYLYELNPDLQPSIADMIIREVSHVCPIDLSPMIEGRNAKNGVICANPDLPKRPDWPEAFYLIHHKTRLSYTLEAPSDFPLPTRIHALATGVQAILESVQANSALSLPQTNRSENQDNCERF
jgi:murein peptide amidase A